MIICVKLSVQLAGDLAIIIQRTGVSLLCLFLSFLSCLIKLPRLWWHVKERENEKIPGASFHLCKNFVQIFDVEHGALWEKGRLKKPPSPPRCLLGDALLWGFRFASGPALTTLSLSCSWAPRQNGQWPRYGALNLSPSFPASPPRRRLSPGLHTWGGRRRRAN